MPSRSILENQVIEWISSETNDRAVERILWISQANDVVFSIALEDDKAFPVMKTYTEFIAGIEANLCKPIDWINSNIPLLEQSIDRDHLLLRDKRGMRLEISCPMNQTVLIRNGEEYVYEKFRKRQDFIKVQSIVICGDSGKAES